MDQSCAGSKDTKTQYFFPKSNIASWNHKQTQVIWQQRKEGKNVTVLIALNFQDYKIPLTERSFFQGKLNY